MTRPPLSEVARRLGACKEARDWLHARPGMSWEEALLALCEPAFFVGDGGDWLEWLLGRLFDLDALPAYDVLRAEVRVWREFPELHPYLPEGAFDALDEWERGVLPSDQLPEGHLGILTGPSDDAAVAMGINNRDMQRMIRAGRLQRFAGTWDLLANALGTINPNDSGEAVARLARAVCAEHVPRALRGLKTFVADYRSA